MKHAFSVVLFATLVLSAANATPLLPTAGPGYLNSFAQRDATAIPNAIPPLRNESPTNGTAPAVQPRSAEDTAWSDYYEMSGRISKASAGAFEFQAVETCVIFYFVLTFVAIGIVAACLQFYKGFRSGSDAKTSIRIGTTSLELDTTSSAIVLLVLSGVFFMIYLHFVYPIQNVDSQPSSAIRVETEHSPNG